MPKSSKIFPLTEDIGDFLFRLLAILKNDDEILEKVAMGCQYCLNTEDGYILNDDVYFRARVDMRDFLLNWHIMVKTADFCYRV